MNIDEMESISALLYEHDLVDLRQHGVPKDEYNAEAIDIYHGMSELKSEEEAVELITEVFISWFGKSFNPRSEKVIFAGRELWRSIND
jgi:hypothetical protein